MTDNRRPGEARAAYLCEAVPVRPGASPGQDVTVEVRGSVRRFRREEGVARKSLGSDVVSMVAGR